MPAIRLQNAGLPYRVTKAGALEILLVTTRQTRRWIIPKGWPIKGLKPANSAAREAFEEAGVSGGFCVKRLTDLPMLWSEQWRAIGLQAPAQIRAELG